MTADAIPDRRRQWVLVVRRSFQIPDHVGDGDARRALVSNVEEHLRETGWQGATRAIAEPMVDALLVVGARGELDDVLISVDPPVPGGPSLTRDAAHRLVDRGMVTVDPEHLVFDVTSEYPAEVIEVAEAVIDRVVHYERDRPPGERWV